MLGAVGGRLESGDEENAKVGRFLPRVFAIESEYQRQVINAELAYVRDLVEDLRTDRITWPFVDGAPAWHG